MTISEAISVLTEILEKHGDLELMHIEQDWTCGPLEELEVVHTAANTNPEILWTAGAPSAAQGRKVVAV
jgi:hypothetical protein